MANQFDPDEAALKELMQAMDGSISQGLQGRRQARMAANEVPAKPEDEDDELKPEIMSFMG